MSRHKAIVTLTWEFDSDFPHEQALVQVRRQFDQFLQVKPHGCEYQNFCAQVDLAKLKDRKELIHLASFSPDEVLPYVTDGDARREYRAGDQVYQVRMNSDRYHIFARSRNCVACGLEGTRMNLDLHPNDRTPHFNLYGEEDGRLVLMTKDHIVPRSKGGTDDVVNLRTMCCLCNGIRANYELTMEQIRELRSLQLYNPSRLPRKELRDLINNRRESMALSNPKET